MTHALRAVTRDDLTAVHALCRAIEVADRIPIATPLEEFEEWLDDPHLDLAADTRLAMSGGECIAWGRVYHRPSGEREERVYLFGGVSPAHRGRGVGRALLAWQIERGTQLLRTATTTLPRHVRTQAYDFQESTHRLYARFGLVPVRWNEEMLLDLAAAEPATSAPDGIRIEPWDATNSEAARLVRNESFRDHWGSTPQDAAAWAHDVEAFGSRTDLSFVAFDGDRAVALCRNAHFPGDEAVTGRRDGWILTVGVLRSHRGRGVASALLAASHRAFREAGFTHAALGVDRDNPTGAYPLYERFGYRTMSCGIVRQIEV